MLATGSADKTVRLWDVRTHLQLGQPLRGHASQVSGVAFSPDGRMLATGSADKTVRFWDIRTHAQLGQPLRGSSSDVWSVAFSPDGRTLVSTGADKSVRLWEGILWRDRADLEAQVCHLVGGNLTRAEWVVLAPGLAYHTSCAS
jgi:WD40 repeat protein